MARLVEKDPRVLNMGLCNFDTQRMDEIVEAGIKIATNQVQVNYDTFNYRFESFLTRAMKVFTRRFTPHFQNGSELSKARGQAPNIWISRKHCVLSLWIFRLT